MRSRKIYNMILRGYKEMDGGKPHPESDSTTEIRNKDGVKDVTDIILTLVLDGCFGSEN